MSTSSGWQALAAAQNMCKSTPKQCHKHTPCLLQLPSRWITKRQFILPLPHTDTALTASCLWLTQWKLSCFTSHEKSCVLIHRRSCDAHVRATTLLQHMTPYPSTCSCCVFAAAQVLLNTVLHAIKRAILSRMPPEGCAYAGAPNRCCKLDLLSLTPGWRSRPPCKARSESANLRKQ